MRRSHIIVVLVVAALVLLGFPTPHSRTVEDLVKELDWSRILEDGESLQESWTDMKGQTRIVVDIQSTEDVEVRLAGITSITQSNQRSSIILQTAFTISPLPAMTLWLKYTY